jgi:hypothetical protein
MIQNFKITALIGLGVSALAGGTIMLARLTGKQAAQPPTSIVVAGLATSESDYHPMVAILEDLSHHIRRGTGRWHALTKMEHTRKAFPRKVTSKNKHKDDCVTAYFEFKTTAVISDRTRITEERLTRIMNDYAEHTGSTITRFSFDDNELNHRRSFRMEIDIKTKDGSVLNATIYRYKQEGQLGRLHFKTCGTVTNVDLAHVPETVSF